MSSDPPVNHGPVDANVRHHEACGIGWMWGYQDSNLGPAGYEPVALTAEL